MGRNSSAGRVREFYGALSRAWGPQNWWPANTAFEVIVGAFLTQNTAWTNVERAMTNLRGAGVLSMNGIRGVSVVELEDLIRPAGYFRQKAKRLKAFVTFLDSRYAGSLERMFEESTPRLRNELLELNGIGPETADSILLYAGNHPVFVVDAYTRRVVERHGIFPVGAHYEDIRELFEAALADGAAPGENACDQATAAQSTGRGSAHEPSRMSAAPRCATAQHYNEMHALIVGVGKNYCLKKAPKCHGCPLEPFLKNPL